MASWWKKENSPLLNVLIFCALFMDISCLQDATYSLLDYVDNNSAGDIAIETKRQRRQANNLMSVTTQAPDSTTFPGDLEFVEDDHVYYSASVYNTESDFTRFWLEDDSAITHKTLSDNYRVAVRIPLKFNFLFYGHEVSTITIATGGFLYMSPFLHKWLTATQYIAPLMANFDTTLGNESHIIIYEKDSMFAVEWKNVFLQDQNHSNPFHFQTQLYKNGTVAFVYKKLPIPVPFINKNNHPVKIGMSDAYYEDKQVSVAHSDKGHNYSNPEGRNKRTIFEYHKVDISDKVIREGTVVVLHPIPTCNLLKTCTACVTTQMTFKCKWCNEVKRCSDGYDWHRQNWIKEGCDQLVSTDTCGNDFLIGIIIAIVVLLLILIGAIAGWVYYAYTHPNTPSGQWLIEHRPSVMKQKLSKMKFWKKSTPTGDRYRVEAEA